MALTRNVLPALGLILSLSACSAPAESPDRPTSTPPSFVIGEFQDDYGLRYTISESVWKQLPNATYHIARWDSSMGFLVAQNDADNPGEALLWTRIDWMKLEGMAPYEWAYCLSAFDADSADDAAMATIAERANPRTGCNGFPFSRMKARGGEEQPELQQ